MKQKLWNLEKSHFIFTFYLLRVKRGILGQKTVFLGGLTECEVDNCNVPQKQDPIVGIDRR